MTEPETHLGLHRSEGHPCVIGHADRLPLKLFGSFSLHIFRDLVDFFKLSFILMKIYLNLALMDSLHSEILIKKDSISIMYVQNGFQ